MRQLFKRLPLGGKSMAMSVGCSSNRFPYSVHSLVLCVFLIGVGSLGFAARTYAGVTQINVTCVQSPTFAGASFGSVGQYDDPQGTFR